MISCARGVSGRSAHRRTLVESVVFCRAPALRGNLRLLMAALGRLKWRCFLLRFCNQMVPVALASMGDMCSELYGRIPEKIHPCARPCAVLVQCLERLVHLDFAKVALWKADFRNYQTKTASSPYALGQRSLKKWCSGVVASACCSWSSIGSPKVSMEAGHWKTQWIPVPFIS